MIACPLIWTPRSSSYRSPASTRQVSLASRRRLTAFCDLAYVQKTTSSFISLGRASTGYWPIHRRCANKLCAYGVFPLVLVKLLYRLWFSPTHFPHAPFSVRWQYV